MIYDISARIKNGKIIYAPKHRKGDSKGHRLRLIERVNNHNKKGASEPMPEAPKKTTQLKLFY